MVMRATTRVARRAAESAQVAGPSALDQLRALAVVGRVLDEDIDRELLRARADGASWSALGEVLGMSPQGARYRHAAATRRVS